MTLAYFGVIPHLKQTPDDGGRSSLEDWTPGHLSFSQGIDPLHVSMEQCRKDVVLGQQGVADML